MAGQMDDTETDGYVHVVPKQRSHLDSFSVPGRDPDKAEDLLRLLLESAA